MVHGQNPKSIPSHNPRSSRRTVHDPRWQRIERRTSWASTNGSIRGHEVGRGGRPSAVGGGCLSPQLVGSLPPRTPNTSEGISPAQTPIACAVCDVVLEPEAEAATSYQVAASLSLRLLVPAVSHSLRCSQRGTRRNPPTGGELLADGGNMLKLLAVAAALDWRGKWGVAAAPPPTEPPIDIATVRWTDRSATGRRCSPIRVPVCAPTTAANVVFEGGVIR